MLVKVVVMAGGEGIRLRPLTVNRPKPMIPVVNKPLLEYIIMLLRDQGFNEIGITLHYMPSIVMDYFGDGSKWGVKINYSIEEDKPRGTAGGVKYLIEKYGWHDDTIIVFSGDLLTNIDLRKLLKYHEEKGSVFTIALKKVSDPTQYGIALLDSDSRVVKFVEKPSWTSVFSDLANMGIYVIEPEVLKNIPVDQEYDFAKNLIPDLLKKNTAVYGFHADEYYWCDIGDIEQYWRVHIDMIKGVIGLKLWHLKEVSPGIFTGEDVEVDPSVEIEPPVVIGDGTRIGKYTVLKPYSFIGNNNIIGDKVSIENSIIWNNNYIGHSTMITRSIIADQVHIDDHVTIMENVIIADETKIKRGATIKPGVLIWPSKIIDPYTIVNTSIKWGIRWYKTLFDLWGITGLANIEITPEQATRIGSVIGSILQRGSRVLVASDNHVASQVIKLSLISGLLSSGVNVSDLGIVPLPVLTNYLVKQNYELAIMINALSYDPSKVRVKIYDKQGPLTREKVFEIEKIFFREMYRRVVGFELGILDYPREHIETYINDVFRIIDPSALNGLRIIVDCSYGAASSIWSRIIGLTSMEVYLVNCSSSRPASIVNESIVDKSIDTIPNVIRSLGLNAGFIYDNDGDKVMVVDDNGRIINNEKLAVIISKILAEKIGRGNVVVPHSYPKHYAEKIMEAGLEIVYSEHGLINQSRYITRETLLIMDDRGGFTYPWFHRGSDAILTSLLILEYIGKNKIKLSRLNELVPEYYTLKEYYSVPFDKRGILMKKIYEELRGRDIDVLDGVKIFEEGLGMVYIRLVPSEPVIEIRVESDSIDKAERLYKITDEIIKRIINSI